VVVAVGTAALGSPARGQIYQWTDGEGVAHYSTDLERVPEVHRPGVRVIYTPTPTDEPAAAPAPGAVSVTAGSPLLVDAHLNGMPLTLLVDTGATRTVIAPDVLARAGIDAAQGRPVKIVGVGGSAEGREVMVPRLEVAGTALGPLGVLAHDVPGLPVDGLLGRDVLDRFILTIDAGRGRAIFSR
jgi:hypothetical protein